MSHMDGGITLALGGGGARGFAHVGVMQVLHERGVPIRAVVGSSSGAVAGAGCALQRDPAQMRERVLRFAMSPLARDFAHHGPVGARATGRMRQPFPPLASFLQPGAHAQVPAHRGRADGPGLSAQGD